MATRSGIERSSRSRPAAIRPARRLVAQVPSALVVAVTLALTACGYALVGRGANIPEDVRLVYLAPFENRTQRAEVEQFITQAMADELVTRRRFTIVSSPEADVDAVLSGAVTSFAVTPITFDDAGRATEYEITILAQVIFKRPEAEEPIWANDRYQFRENYEVEADAVGFFDRENLAIEETAEKFAESVVTDLLEGF
ncbi:MAG TPA: LPS assembly lipoprotein LptE [Thermoanaerobaculia bacterium]|nr:LPS assembly lipoprotein LptE [Thermoanaerobaculia bacterium]